MMRIRRLELVRFGMFSDRSFNFGVRPENGSDFHIIYGANETGKTTAMEGYLRLIYGFPLREPYDFFHQRKNLLVRGDIELNGVLKSVSRLPVRKQTLIDEFGTALQDSFFHGVLSGLEQTEYRRLFCLNDDTIEKGGDEIAAGKGEIGSLLFGAASGISAASELLDGIRKQAESLYKFRGSKARLPALKREWDEIAEQISAADITASQYQKLRGELDTAQEAVQSARDKRKQLLNRKSRYDSFASALPKLEQVRELTEDLSEFEHYPQQVNFDREILERINEDRIRLVTRRDDLKADGEKLAGELRSVELDPDRLGLLEELENIEEARSRYLTAEPDLPKRQQELNEVVSGMRRAAESLGLSGDADPKSFVLSKPQLSELSRKCSLLKDLNGQVSLENQEIDRLGEMIDDVSAEITGLKGAAAQGTDVSDILERFSVSELISEYRIAAERTEEAAEAAERALNDLSVRGRRFDAVPAAAVTSSEAKDAAAGISDKLKDAEHQRRKLSETDQKREKTADQINQLKAEAGLVSDAEALRLKSVRDERWRRHKASLTSDTADAFESAMRSLDDASERRLAQASNLAELRQAESRARELEIERHAIQKTLSRLESESAEKALILSEVSRDFGIEPPLSPEGLAEWLQKAEAARSAHDDLAAENRRHTATFAKAAEARDALAAALELEVRSADFISVAAMAGKAAEGHREHSRKLGLAQDRLDGHRRDQRRRRRNIVSLQEKKSGAEKDLENYIAGIFGCDVGRADLDGFQETLQELRNLNQLRSEIEHRVSRMNADREGFRRTVNDVARRFDVPPAEDPRAMFSELKRIGDSARRASSRHGELLKRSDKARSELESVSRKLDQQDIHMRELSSCFPSSLAINSLEDLREAVAKTEEIIAKRRMLEKLELEIRTELAVSDMEEARTLLADLTLAEIKSHLEESARDAELADRDLQEAVGNSSRAETMLGAVTGDDEIAVLVEKRRTIELEMQEAALEYLELSFGCRVAEAAIRRFSEKHRSGMLKATENAFSELTEGAYQKLRTQHDGGSENLVAIDSANSAKRAEDLSKGTRFQLYLALRSAAYEQMASSGTIMPFFCDDVFETFDEDRTRAACALMARIGRTGQAIYLTHHRHVTDIAKDVCGDGIRLHEL